MYTYEVHIRDTRAKGACFLGKYQRCRDILIIIIYFKDISAFFLLHFTGDETAHATDRVGYRVRGGNLQRYFRQRREGQETPVELNVYTRTIDAGAIYYVYDI